MSEKSEKLTKKEIIMKEAEKIFAEKGFHNTTVRDIAKGSGSNIAMLYYYFDDKESLYNQILESTFSKISEIVDESMEKGITQEEKIRLFITSYIKYLGSRQDTGRIIAWDVAEGGRFIPKIAKKYLSRNYARLREAFATGMREGAFNPLDEELTPLSMIGMIIFFFFSSPMIKIILKTRRYDAQFLDRLTTHTMDLVFNGLLRHTNKR